MDNPSLHALKFIEALAGVNEQLIGLAQKLRLRTDVIRAVHNIEPRRYRTGSVIEGYVDIELTSGRAIAWLFDIRWTDTHWLIESSISLNHEKGQDTIQAFPARTANTLDEFVDQLTLAIVELTGDEQLIEIWRKAKRDPE